MIAFSGCVNSGNSSISQNNQKKKFFIGQSIKSNDTKEIAEKELEKISEAEDNTKTVLDPEYSDVLSSQAFNLIRDERYEEAIIMFDRAVSLNPGNVIAAKGKSRAEAMLNNGDTRQITESKNQAQSLIGLQQRGNSNEAAYFLNTGSGAGEIKTDENCKLEFAGNNISKTFFPGIELYWNIPQEFRLGEIINIAGKVNNGSSSNTVSVVIGPPEDQHVFYGTVQDKMFTVPVYFNEVGEHLLTVFSGEQAKAKAKKIIVSDPTCEPSIKEKSVMPTNFRYKISDGEPIFYWDDKENNLFRIEFSQKTQKAVFFVHDETRFAPPLNAFKNFEEGAVTVRIWGAKTGKNSLDRQSMWMPGEEKEVFATGHVSRKGNKIQMIKMNEDFVIGETVEIRGETDLELEPSFIIVDRNGDDSYMDLAIAGNKFFGQFKPDKLGTHLIGIYEKDGAELFVAGIVPRGALPLIPDYFDLDNQKYKIETAKVAENMLRYVNHERSIRKKPIVDESTKLDELAQFRADDMCSNNYFLHTDYDGKTADHYKSTYGIINDITENIVEESDIRAAHEKIIRSPKYFSNIINGDYSRIGFGVCKKSKDSSNYIIVQILEKPANSSKLITTINNENSL